MHERRTTYGAAVRLALVYSAVAALMAMALQSIGGVSTTRLVVTVIVVGFATSWVLTGRIARTASTAHAHRVTMLPLRQSIG